jgi:hypothetical protein
MNVWGWLRGERGARGETQPPCPPSLEPLEARLLLSADLIGTEIFASLQVSLRECAIDVDVDRQDQGIEEYDPCLILTYLASADETGPSQVAESGGSTPAGTEDDSSVGQPLDDTMQPVEANVGVTGTLVTTPLGQVESAVQIAADSDEMAAPIQNESDGLIVSGQQDR